MILKIFLLSLALTPIIAFIHPCTSRSREFMPNPRGCSWYWRCRDNETNLLDEPVEELCENEDHFDYYNQTCGPFDERCTYDDDLFNRTPDECTPWRQDLIPHVLYCNMFYICWQTSRVEMTCPEGEHFSYFQNGCTNEVLADCRTEHNYCRRMKDAETEAKRSPFSCETYHVCNECNNRYSLIELHCVNGTHQFDDNNQQCDDADRVNCTMSNNGGGGSTVAPIDLPPEPHSIQCTREDVENEFVIHPGSCFYFFNCASGRSTLYACPIGSFFDTDKGQCWPHEDGFVCPGTETTTEVQTTT